MNDQQRFRRGSTIVPAWMCLVCPICSWLSQYLFVTFIRPAPPSVSLLAAFTQGVLLLAGVGFGIWALYGPGRKGIAVLLPAMTGMAFSVGTLMLILIIILARP